MATAPDHGTCSARKNAELVLLGRRGNAKRQAKDVREVISAHSRKPEALREGIERYCAGALCRAFRAL
jgi:N6-adenosine-specific RNA methylase IME4